MKRLTLLMAVIFVFLLAWNSPLFATDDRHMSPEDWATLKHDFSGHPGSYMGEDPRSEMTTSEREWDARCRVCPRYPQCPSGYTQVGYTEVINMVYYQGWGTDNVGPGGFTNLISDTIVVDKIAEHDHIKASHCRKN